MKRRSGVLLPISSLPSEYGIGCFSKEAYEFVDFLEKADQSLWQILPLGPTGYGDSPYQSFSTFAGNPYFIDLQELIKEGWLTKEDCKADYGTSQQYVDYDKMYKARFKVLRRAFDKSNIGKKEDFKAFCKKNSFWLDDYALYMAVKNSFGGNGWNTWDEDIKLRKPKAMKAYREKYADDILFYQFQQYLFDRQWKALKKYANEKGVEIVGDIPIYVAFDSADTWANPELFQLDKDGTPKAVAGCPPDAFSATGQLWGNPLYNWPYHEKTGFEWWMKRLGYCFDMYDVVRIDHFRGFDEYYSIPYGDPTAEFGHWEKGPGFSLFKRMKEVLGNRDVIAEDLGFLTPSVVKLVKKTGYPGMKILLFAFDHREPSNYLPQYYDRNSVVYTGTHDNDTVVGWIKSASRKDVAFAREYTGVKRNKELPAALVRAALASVSDTCIIPIQDYLEVDNSARINLPSTLGDNWKWRMKKGQLTDDLAKRMSRLTWMYGRSTRR